MSKIEKKLEALKAKFVAELTALRTSDNDMSVDRILRNVADGKYDDFNPFAFENQKLTLTAHLERAGLNKLAKDVMDGAYDF